MKNIKKKIKNKYLRWKAKRGLVRKYEYLQAVNELLEEWITKRILEGQQGRRKELQDKQNEIRETAEFIKFLKKIK